MNRPRRHSDQTVSVRPRRAGALLMELIAAVALFTVVIAIAVPVIASVTAIREESRRRQFVQLELANVMEQIVAGRRSHGSLEAAVSAARVSPALESVLPESSLTIDVAPADDLPRCLRITARLTWTTASGDTAPPAELTAFLVDGAPQETAP